MYLPLVPLGGFDVDLHPAIKFPSSRPPSSSTTPWGGPPGSKSSMELELEIPGTGGLSCSSRRYFVRDDLKLLRVTLRRMNFGMIFHNLAPVTLNDASYILCIFGLHVFDIGGILQQGPRRVDSKNSNWRSLGVSEVNILNMCIIRYLSRRRCSDIRLSFLRRSQ